MQQVVFQGTSLSSAIKSFRRCITRPVILAISPRRLHSRASTTRPASCHVRAISSSSSSLSESLSAVAVAEATRSSPPRNEDDASVIYVGPLTQTFRRLKIFSLSSLALASTLSPFIFIVESSLPSTPCAAYPPLPLPLHPHLLPSPPQSQLLKRTSTSTSTSRRRTRTTRTRRRGSSSRRSR